MSEVVFLKDLHLNNLEVFSEGLVVGKFAPLTLGHINFIKESATGCKKLTVVLCFDEKWLSKQSKRDRHILTHENRLNWLRKELSSHDNITITSINETHLAPYPNGWSEYANLLRGLFHNNIIPEKTAIFSSEIEYNDGYETHLPELTHVVVDPNRTAFNISATMVRERLYHYWDWIPASVKSSYNAKLRLLCGIKDKRT